MTNSEDRPVQEVASTYFSSIVRRNVAPMTVEQLPADTVDEFNRQVRQSLALAKQRDAQ